MADFEDREEYKGEERHASPRRGIVLGAFVVLVALGAAFFWGRSSGLKEGESRSLRTIGGTGEAQSEHVLRDAADAASQAFRAIVAPHKPQPAFVLELNRESSATFATSGSRGRTDSAEEEPREGGKNAPAVALTTAEEEKNSRVKKDEAARRPLCGFGSGGAPIRRVFFSEIAWMGTSASANNEWIEIRNNTRERIALSGWQIQNDEETIAVVFGDRDSIAPTGFFLLERTDDDPVSAIAADKIYAGALANAGARLKLFDAECVLHDEINAEAGWPGGDNSTKQTLERNNDDFSWQTSVESGGTPSRENSKPAPRAAQTGTPASSPPPPSSQSRHALGVSIAGSGSGTVSDETGGIRCGFDCSESYDAGARVTLAASPEGNSIFVNWSGACSGNSFSCVIIISGPTAVTAVFKNPTQELGGAAPPPAPSPAPGGSSQILISEIMAGSHRNADDEFIELYNPTQYPADLTGWSLKKKTSSGAEYALVAASRLQGKVVNPNSYFLIGNEGGYSGSVSPDATWATSNTLAYTNNTVLLYNSNGVIIEEVFWAEIPKSQSYARQSWTSSQFAVQETPTPRNRE